MACIAVVDDDPAFVALLGEMLELEGWDMHAILEGEAASERLARLRPDCVILDVRMEREGTTWAVLERLQLDPETRAIPVIVCSAALDDLREREPWLTEHGVGILPKPFDLDDLHDCVRTALQTRRPGCVGLADAHH